MKLHCPMCGRIAVDSSWNFGEVVTVCGCAAVIRFQAATDGRGRRSCVAVASEAAVETPDFTAPLEQYPLKQNHDGAAARGCGFKPEDVGEMKHYPLGSPNDPPMVPGWYVITSVKPAREKTWRDRAIEEPLL